MCDANSIHFIILRGLFLSSVLTWQAWLPLNRLLMNLTAHMNKSATIIIHRCLNLHVKQAMNRPSVLMLFCIFVFIFRKWKIECISNKSRYWWFGCYRLPDEIILNKLGIFIHPRFHPSVFGIIFARCLTRWYRWRQGDTRTRIYIFGTRCVPLLGRHSAMWLVYAAQMQTYTRTTHEKWQNNLLIG